MNRLFKAAFIIPFLFCVILMSILFLQNKKTAPSPQAPDNPPQTASIDSTPEPAVEYLLIAEDGYLNLYQKSDILSMKYSERLDTLLLPHSDRTALTKGLQFQSLEDAYCAMESFIN